MEKELIIFRTVYAFKANTDKGKETEKGSYIIQMVKLLMKDNLEMDYLMDKAAFVAKREKCSVQNGLKVLIQVFFDSISFLSHLNFIIKISFTITTIHIFSTDMFFCIIL